MRRLYMDALDNFESTWLRPWLWPTLFAKLLWAFIAMDCVKVRTKLEVGSFTRAAPRYAHVSFWPKF